MAVYTFDSTSVRDYTILDNGGLVSAVSESQDFGTLDNTPTTNLEYNEIVFTDVAYPYGSASFSGGATVNEFSRNIPTEKAEIKVSGSITANVVFHWTGSGTAFEIAGGQELIVAPWTVSSGTLRNSFSKSIIGSGSLFNIGFIDEGVVYDYNLSSDNDYSIGGDYGTVEETVGEEFIVNGDFIVTGNYILASAYDYGTINEVQYAGEYDYGLVNVTDDEQSVNILFSISGESITDLTPVYTKIGTGLFNISGTAESEFKPHWRGRGGLFISGGESDSFSRPYEGSGSILSINSSKDSASYSYTQSSIEIFDEINYGFINQSSSSVDYGYVSESSYVGFDYGYVVATDEDRPYGLFSFIGEAYTEYKPTFTDRGTGLFNISGTSESEFKPHWRGRGGLFISGGEGDSFARPYSGSGNLFSIIDSKNNATYEYNESSIERFGSTDYGTVTNSGTINDYGYVYESSYVGFDYGYVLTTDEDRPYGLFSFAGEAVTEYKPTFTSFGTGLFNVSGESKSEFKPHWRGRGGINVSGGERDSLTKPYVGSGNLFSIGDITESAAYDYNESSVEYYSSTINYGLISESVDEEFIVIGDFPVIGTYIIASAYDYDLITNDSYIEQDYGYVINIEENIPYGLFKLGGEAVTEYKPTFTISGSGLLNTSGSAETQFKPHWRGRGGINVSGGERDSLTKPYVGSGNLFNIGDITENVVYDYNESSIEFYRDSQNYGLVTESGDALDYGYVYGASYIEYDYGYVLTTDEDRPYGLFELKGQALTEYKPSFDTRGTGLFNISGDAKTQFKPQWNGFGLIQLSGGERDSLTKPYVGSGNLFSIGDIIENVVYDYNESSIEKYDDSTDYGFVNESATSVDYGYVSNSSYIEYDYGYVITSIEDRPYGLFLFAGEAVTEYKPSFDTRGTGLFNISGDAKTQFKPQWNGFGTIQLSGGERDSFTRPYIGEGNLFTIGTNIESATYDYNESSVEIYDGYDYQLISSASSVTSDYGLIFNPSYDEYDYGYVVTPYTDEPFGLFNISGSASIEYIPNNLVIGKGLLQLDGAAKTIFTPNWNGFGVLQTSGTSIESTNKPYIGSGNLFTLGEKIESVTFEYNSSSIDVFEEINYEFITVADNQQNDYGIITEEAYNGEIDYGTVINKVETRPYGSISISGSANSPRKRQTIVGGSLFGFGGASESFTAQTPEDTVFYTFSGSAIEKNTESYRGSGNIYNYKGQSAPTDFRFTPWWRGYGEIILSGTSEKEKIKNYVSRDGSLFGVDGAAESFTAQTPEDTVFYTFSGSAIEKNTENYVGDGSLFGFSGAVESQTDFYTPVETLFSVSGSAIEKHTESYVGTGNINVYTDNVGYEWLNYRPSPRYVTVFGEVFVSGSGEESTLKEFIGSGNLDLSGNSYVTRTNKFNGSGSIFSFQGSSETRTFAFATETGLFSVSGNVADSYSRIYNGSGTLFGFNSATESATVVATTTGLFSVYGESKNKYVPNWNGSGSINLYDESDTSRARDYITSGSLFGFGGGAESFSAQTPENTVVFNISGFATQSFTKGNYSASGSEFVYGSLTERKTKAFAGFGVLFGFNSSTESRSISLQSETSLYTIYGNSENSRSRIFTASGSLFGFDGAAESFSAQTPENTALYVVSGSSENSRTRTYDGTGSFFGFGSASESSTISHQTETALYSVQGNSEERFTRGAYQSSGSLFGFDGAAESFSAQTPENTALYVVSGTSGESSSRTYVGDTVTYTLSGSSVERFTRGAYQSSGSLFGFNGAAESFSAQTPENTALFVFDGTKKESFSKGNYTASGSLFGIGSSAESSTNVIIIEPDLFKIFGSASEAFTKSTYNGSGLYEVSGESSILTTQSFEGSGTQIISGESSVLLTFGYTGDGTISIPGNGDFHVEYKTDATTAEFIFYGGTDGSRTIISVTNNLEINISGASIDYVRLFTPPRKFGTII